MYTLKCLAISVIVFIQCWSLSACGIAVHNEVTYRSLENFIPRTDIQKTYKDVILDSASYSQAGSFFPDWGYNCLGYNQQSEDAHWPTFIKAAVNYIREVYPISDFHSDKHVKGLISFIFAIMSHGMADVKWHSLSGLSDYFVVAMAKSDFNGNTKESHIAADAGADFALRHSSKLSYLNETWQVPVKDIIEIYTRLYAKDESSPKKRIPLESHIQYCMAAAFAASKIDVEFGQFMFGYYGSKSPFLTEELYDYYRGGIEDMSASVSDCYSEMVDAFEHGAKQTSPDTLCANYFYTTNHKKTLKCLKPEDSRLKSGRQLDSLIHQDYDTATGVLTLTTAFDKQQQHTSHDNDTLSPVATIVRPQHEGHQVTRNVRLRFQSPIKVDEYPESTVKRTKKCQSINYIGNEISSVTLTVPMSSARLGHQIASGYFQGNGQVYLAISAPYNFDQVSQEQTGTVFILNSKEISESGDVRQVAKLAMNGSLPHGRFGWSMTTIDIDRDGIDDLAISTPGAGIVEIHCGRANIGLDDKPTLRFQLQQPHLLLGAVLTGIDVDQDEFKDLVIGCPLCSVENQPQAGVVYIFKSAQGLCATSRVFTQPDISIVNPNIDSTTAEYDHFGQAILQIEDTLLISAPGFSIESKQRVGRVYAFDLATRELKWSITGTKEFQQFGRVLATDNNEIVAISCPSEETTVGLQKFWQGGAVRIYSWKNMQQIPSSYEFDNVVTPDFDMEHGMISIIQGRTNAGHLGQSISILGNHPETSIWIGEPMSERENGRVYHWAFNDDSKEIECIRNNEVLLARFGSQIGPLGTDAICITSQRYGQNARYPGAVTFLYKN